MLKKIRNYISKIVKFEQLSTYEALSLLISIIGLLSLLYATKQIKQQSDSLESAAWQAIQNQQMELNKKFVEESVLLPYFFSGQTVDRNDVATYHKALALADLKIDFFDSLWGQRKHIPELRDNTPAWTAWEKYIKSNFENSPVMCERLNSRRDWYTEDFVKFANENGCSKLIR